jgi:hypothetical protein
MVSAALPSLGYRRFMWGLSTGILILTVAGFVWFSWAISAFEDWRFAAAVFAPVAGVAVGLVWAGVRVRRKAAGFSIRDLKQGTAEERGSNRTLTVGFLWVIAAEWTGCGLAAFFTYHFGHGELFPPALSLVVGLHFFPLAALFRLPFYHMTAAFGSLVSLAGLLTPSTLLTPDARQILAGAGLGVVLWASAVYALFHADRLAATASPDRPE